MLQTPALNHRELCRLWEVHVLSARKLLCSAISRFHNAVEYRSYIYISSVRAVNGAE